jgi:hypothetical protein
MLATITTDLDKIAPRFELRPEQITIIQTPAEFYETLKVGDFVLHFFNILFSVYSSSTSLSTLAHDHHNPWLCFFYHTLAPIPSLKYLRFTLRLYRSLMRFATTRTKVSSKLTFSGQNLQGSTSDIPVNVVCWQD